jgi:exodeoxyribonuclease V gamma subunit
MLFIHHSNQLEVLLHQLHTQISVSTQVPTEIIDPFEPIIIIVPHTGMKRWLAQQIAVTTSITANFSFQSQEKFFWQMLRGWERNLPERPPWSKDALTWMIMQSLPELIHRKAFEEIFNYLSYDVTDVRLFQLSQQIAVIFENYLLFRANLLLNWEQGNENHWQAQLWRYLITNEKLQLHWSKILRTWRIINKPDPIKALPTQIFFFGIDILAPVYKEFIEVLSKYINITIFYLNPAQNTWFNNQLSTNSKSQSQVNKFYQLNKLLSNFGYAKQIVLQQLSELAAKQHSTFIKQHNDTVLHRLQNDILEAHNHYNNAVKDQRSVFNITDISIQIHSCHSHLRETQVLRDNLLTLFNTLPNLKPREILVIAPNMNEYAPYVEAVFGAIENDIESKSKRIPWAITNRVLDANTKLLILAIETLLKLPDSRFEVSTILSLLHLPFIQRRWNLNAIDLYQIQIWIQGTNIRWGIDANQRAELKLPAEEANTWQYGLNKLYSDNTSVNDIHNLEILRDFINKLIHWRQQLLISRSLHEWRNTLQALCTDLFALDVSEEELIILLNKELEVVINCVIDTQFNRELSAKLFRVIIQQLFDKLDINYPRLFTGKVTFCGLETMRGIPFRVICLLGMNGVNFPRHQHTLSFDLIQQQPYFYDISQRDNDNALFLDTILSARDCLYLSYIGHDIKDNSVKTPSIVISDVVDYLHKIGINEQQINSYIITHYPLQPFSTKLYDGINTRLHSYANEWLETAQSQTNRVISNFITTSLQIPNPGNLELNHLIDFFHNPAQYFLTHQLGIKIFKNHAIQEDLEPFDLDNLQSYKLKAILLPLVQAKQEDELLLEHIKTIGILPHGKVGELIFKSHLEQVKIFVQRLNQYQISLLEPITIDLNVNEWHIQGQIDNITINGIFNSRIGRLRSKDRLTLWLQHLILCIIKPTNIPSLNSLYISEDAEWRLMNISEPIPLIQDLLTLYAQGLSSPLQFFPDSSLTCYEHGMNSKELYKHWNDPNSFTTESQNLAVRIAFRGRNPIDETFADIATRIFAPIKKYSKLNYL